MSSELFINYRQADSGSYRALLYIGLVGFFGPDVVYMDSMSIPAGVDFTVELLAQVRRTKVLLALIGPAWLTATNAVGQRLIDDPADWVRRELATAFAAGVLVIPVLTDGAVLPAEVDLPADIAPLARCQYRWLRAADVTSDLDRLCRDLRRAVPGLECPVDSRQPRIISIWLPGRRIARYLAHWAVAVIVASAAVTPGIVPRHRRRSPRPGEPRPGQPRQSQPRPGQPRQSQPRQSQPRPARQSQANRAEVRRNQPRWDLLPWRRSHLSREHRRTPPRWHR